MWIIHDNETIYLVFGNNDAFKPFHDCVHVVVLVKHLFL